MRETCYRTYSNILDLKVIQTFTRKMSIKSQKSAVVHVCLVKRPFKGPMNQNKQLQNQHN